jgi:hypothetical protein
VQTVDVTDERAVQRCACANVTSYQVVRVVVWMNDFNAKLWQVFAIGEGYLVNAGRALDA